MKGSWVQDPEPETWHLIVERDVADATVKTWCGKEFKTVGNGASMTKLGALITFMDICHDECVRKSEEET